MKKLLLIITVILTSVSAVWADDITVNTSNRIKNLGGKYFTIRYRFTNGNTYPVTFNGSTLLCSNSTDATPVVFYFTNANADDDGLYKVRLYNQEDKYWKYDRGNFLDTKSSAVNIQLFPGEYTGTYRICALTSGNTNNSRCYMAQGIGDELNYNTRNWTSGAESGTISVNVATQAGSGNYCSEVVLTEVNPEFVEAHKITSGWYNVRVGANDYSLTDNYITTMDSEDENHHPATSAALGNNKGSAMLYFEVIRNAQNESGVCGTWIKVRDSKGRYMKRDATSSITEPTDNICCIYNSVSATTQLVFSNGTDNGSDAASPRYSWQAYENYIGLSSQNVFNVFYAKHAEDTYTGNTYTVKLIQGSDGTETITYNGSETHYGFNTVCNNGTFFFAQGVTPVASDFTLNRGSNTAYGDNYGIFIDNENKTINIYQNRDITVPDGYNGYVGGNTNIGETEWKTQAFWKLKEGATWNVGPGYTGSNMWQPIYLEGVTAKGINLEGWEFCANLVNSSLTANTIKIQGTWTIDVANGSELILNMPSGKHSDSGTHTFNINGSMTINAHYQRFDGSETSTNQINLGTTGQFTLNCVDQSSLTTGSNASFTVNATITKPSSYNTIESRTLTTFSNTKITTLSVNISETGGWTQVETYADLSNQTATGEHFYYFVEEPDPDHGQYDLVLHTYKQIIHEVASDEETLSEIDNYYNIKSFNIPSGKKLNVNVNDFDLTKITGSGTINLTANTTLSEGQSIPAKLSGSGIITLNYFPTAETHPTFNDWKGSIEFDDGGNSSTNLTGLFNAWGNSESTIMLNDVYGGYLITYDSNNPTTTAVNPTLNILADKTLILNNGNSKANARISKVTGAGTIDRQGWSGSTQHNLYITTLTGFTGTLNGSGYPIIVENLVLAEGPAVDDLLFKTLGTVTFSKTDSSSKLFIGNVDKTDGYAWEEKTVNNIYGYYITESAPAKIEAAKNEVRPYIGTGTGKYSITFDGKIYTEFETFADDVDKLKTLADWTNKTISYSTINQPTTGYYMLKSKYSENGTTEYYLSCENIGTGDTNAQQTTSTDKKNIFYIKVGNTNSTILSYSTGYYFGNNTRANYTSVTDNPVKWTFSDGNNKGTYKLTSDWSDGSQILYGWSGRDNEAKADRNGAATTDGHTDWILEEVTEIPVTFNSNALGYATFNSPVALKVPTDIKAYICTIDGNTIKLYNADEIKDGNNWVLPAETPVLLYNESYDQEGKGTANFVVTSTNEPDKYSSKNEFSGTVAATRPESGQTYYALRKKFDSTSSTYSMGFYQRSDQNADLTGFRAWIKIPKNQARNLTVIFEGESDPTGIVEALGLQNDNVEIYDLNGRKLSSYQKGINIVNGKKVFK